MSVTDFSKLMTYFLTDYLPLQKNASRNTIISYCDTFRLLLIYFKDELNISPNRLSFVKLTRKRILDFLEWLERERNCGKSTRNQRLAAIHSFVRYVQVEKPIYLLQCQDILGIMCKKCETPIIQYLTVDDMRLLLEQPNQHTKQGRRDLTLLSLLYDSGARVQEIVDLRIRDVRLEVPAVVKLTGKGRKSREVPILKRTVALLQSYFEEYSLVTPDKLDRSLFFNRQGNSLTRAGVTYILHKYASYVATFQGDAFIRR